MDGETDILGEMGVKVHEEFSVGECTEEVISASVNDNGVFVVVFIKVECMI